MVVAIVPGALSCAGHSTKQTTSPAPPAPIRIFPAAPAWTGTLDGSATAPATADRTRVYLPLDNGRLVAIDRETGVPAWSAEVATSWPLQLIDTSVYALNPDGLIEITAATGAIARRFPLPGSPTGPMTRSGDLLLIPVGPAGLVAWHIRDARETWKQTLAAPTRLAPVIVGGVVFVVQTDSRVTALALTDGHPRWTTTLAGEPLALAANRTRVVVAASDRVVYALDATSGAIAWPDPAAADIMGIAVDDTRVYIAALDNTVRALSSGNGNQRWKQVLENRILATPVMTPGGLLITGIAPALQMLSADTGSVLGSYELPALTVAAWPPLVLSDRAEDGVVAVVVMRDGQILGMKTKPPEKKLEDAPGDTLTPPADSGPK